MSLALDSTRKIYTVSEITAELKDLLESEYPRISIQGEISNFKSYPSGHYYFTIKDEDAQISAVMFKGYNQNLKFEIENIEIRCNAFLKF